MKRDVEAELKRFLKKLVKCFDEEGEFNNWTAPLGTVEIREEAERLLKEIGK